MRPSHALLGLFVVALGDFNTTGAAPTVSLDDIVRTWQLRQERTHSLIFEYDHKELHVHPSTEDSHGSRGSTQSITQKCKLWMSGAKIAFRWDAEDDPRGAFAHTYRSTFDGDQAAMLFIANTNEGVIDDKTRSIDADVVYLKPIYVTYRALDPSIGAFDPQQARVLPETVPLSDRPCILVREPKGSGLVRTYWVDPSRDCVVPRYTEEINGVQTIQLDVSYTQDDSHGWTPARWKLIFMDASGEMLLESGESRVASFAINVPIPESTFTMTWPPLTLIQDRRNHNQNYLVSYDGSPRAVTHAELLTHTRQELLERHRTTWSRGLTILAVAGILLTVILFIRFVTRRSTAT